MKKKLLFIIPGLDAGGAEKSLINLLNTIDEERFYVDLFLFSHKGLFLDQIPKFVNIIPKNPDLVSFQKSLFNSLATLVIQGKFSLAKNRFLFFWKNRFYKNSTLAEQYSWRNFKNAFITIEKKYDSAIGFLEKSSIYFVVDKVKADNKIGFIHTFFSELNMDVEFEKKYISKINTLAAVSKICAEDLKNIFPQDAEKIVVIPNIVSSELIQKLATEKDVEMQHNSIISIGRLIPLKGFDIAIEAGLVLKRKNIPFHWYILGDGSEKQRLENLIATLNLKENFTMLGLIKNPYPYIKKADVFVQTSRYEGKSIAVDEAKILAKPIVLTNFATAKDQIMHNKNGQIVDMTAEAVAQGILNYFENKTLTEKIVANLKSENFGTQNEIEEFYKIING